MRADITLDEMSTKRRPSGKSKESAKQGDRHLQRPFQLRMNQRLRLQLEKLADRNASDITDEIRIAIRKHLEANGLWPVGEANCSGHRS